MRYVSPISRQATSLEEGSGWIAGIAFTLLLFLGMAHFENKGPETAAADIEDLRVYSFPTEAPPPDPVVSESEPRQEMPSISGLDVGESDSAVHIAVVPRDLEALVPTTTNPPPAKANFLALPSELKPRANIDIDPNRTYRVSEVDQEARAIVRVPPPIPTDLFSDDETLRVNLMLVIDQNGRAVSARVIESSGNPIVDKLVIETVTYRWQFSPAKRHGKAVRQFAQQAFRISRGGSSPFTVQ